MRVTIIGARSATGATAERLRRGGHAVVESELVESGAAEATEGADVVIGLLASDAQAARLYVELARTAVPGQLHVDGSPLLPATQAWCALALPAFVHAGSDGLRGEPGDVLRAQDFARALP